MHAARGGERGGGRAAVAQHGRLERGVERRVGGHQHAGLDDLRLARAALRRAGARRAPRAPRRRRRARSGRRPAPRGARPPAGRGRRRPPGRAAGRGRPPRRATPEGPAAAARPSALGAEGAPERGDDQRRGRRTRVLVADGALAEVGRPALARLHRHRRARALLRGGRRPRRSPRRGLRRPRRPRAARPRRVRARRPSSCRRARPRRARPRRPAPRRARRRAPGRRAPARRRPPGRHGAGRSPTGARSRRRPSRPASCPR